jgi:hypothetical protein
MVRAYAYRLLFFTIILAQKTASSRFNIFLEIIKVGRDGMTHSEEK